MHFQLTLEPRIALEQEPWRKPLSTCLHPRAGRSMGDSDLKNVAKANALSVHSWRAWGPAPLDHPNAAYARLCPKPPDTSLPGPHLSPSRGRLPWFSSAPYTTKEGDWCWSACRPGWAWGSFWLGSACPTNAKGALSRQDRNPGPCANSKLGP
jgi:hypothetical protein